MHKLSHKKYPIDDKVIQFYSTKIKQTQTVTSNPKNNVSLADYFFKQLDTLGGPTMFTQEIDAMPWPLLQQYLKKIEFPVSIPSITKRLLADPVPDENYIFTQKPYYVLGQLFSDICLLSANCRVFNEKNQRFLDHAEELEGLVLNMINKAIQIIPVYDQNIQCKIKPFATYKTFEEVTFLLFPPGLIPNIYVLTPMSNQVAGWQNESKAALNSAENNVRQNANYEQDYVQNNNQELTEYYEPPQDITNNMTCREDLDNFMFYLSKIPLNFLEKVLGRILILLKNYKGTNKPFTNFYDENWQLDLKQLQQPAIQKIQIRVLQQISSKQRLDFKTELFQTVQNETKQHREYKKPNYSTIQHKIKDDEIFQIENYVLSQFTMKYLLQKIKIQERRIAQNEAQNGTTGQQQQQQQNNNFQSYQKSQIIQQQQQQQQLQQYSSTIQYTQFNSQTNKMSMQPSELKQVHQSYEYQSRPSQNEFNNQKQQHITPYKDKRWYEIGQPQYEQQEAYKQSQQSNYNLRIQNQPYQSQTYQIQQNPQLQYRQIELQPLQKSVQPIYQEQDRNIQLYNGNKLQFSPARNMQSQYNYQGYRSNNITQPTQVQMPINNKLQDKSTRSEQSSISASPILTNNGQIDGHSSQRSENLGNSPKFYGDKDHGIMSQKQNHQITLSNSLQATNGYNVQQINNQNEYSVPPLQRVQSQTGFQPLERVPQPVSSTYRNDIYQSQQYMQHHSAHQYTPRQQINRAQDSAPVLPLNRQPQEYQAQMLQINQNNNPNQEQSNSEEQDFFELMG